MLIMAITSSRACARKTHLQRGLVLLLSLIVLAAMSLAAIGLMRSVLTSNRVAANLTFQQSALQSADVGVEQAIAWLEQRVRATTQNNIAGQVVTTPNPQLLWAPIARGPGQPFAYSAVANVRGVNQTWDAYWAQLTANNLVNPLPVDAAGNQVSLVIDRLCTNIGNPLTVGGCQAPAALNSAVQTSGKGGGLQNKISLPGQVFYRITVRVQGPRNAVSYVQSVVAL